MVEEEDNNTLTTAVVGRSGTGAFATNLSRFDLGEKLGAGGMAVVYRALDKETGERVALKIIDNPDDDDAQRRARFEREVRSAGRLLHQNICRVLCFGRAPGKLFIAMELVEGITLQDLIKRRASLPLAVALEVLRQLLGALEAARQGGVVHRDLKPANIMVTPEGQVKLLDFGIAKSQEDATVTATGFLVGTPAFMSPEQVFGSGSDHRSDLFSAGITLLVMLTGRVRFRGMEPGAVMARVASEPVASLLEEAPSAPNDVDTFLAQLCAQRLEDRFQTAAAAIEALEKLPDLPQAVDGPLLLQRYTQEPDAVADALARDGAARARARADALLASGPPGLPAAAIAMYRASLLEPDDDTRQRLAAICGHGNFTFGEVNDPRITEALAAFQLTPAAPGVLKRLADLYRARGQLLLAAAYLIRYLRVKPADSHAAQQLRVLLDGPNKEHQTIERLRTRDIVAGIKTGGHVDPALPRRQHPGAKGALTAAGLRPVPQEASGPPHNAPPPSAPSPVPPPTQVRPTALSLAARAAATPRPATDPSAMARAQPLPPILIQASSSSAGPSSLHPLILVVAAVAGAAVLLAFFSRFIATTVDAVQVTVSDNEHNLARYERNNIDRAMENYLKEARVQFKDGRWSAAIRQTNLLLASDPAAEQALEALYIRARCRIEIEDRRTARTDLDEYLAKSPLSDPRRPEVMKLLEEVHEYLATH